MTFKILARPQSTAVTNQGLMHGRACALPHQVLPELRTSLDEGGSRLLSVNLAGTECYDYSAMGSNRKLNGPTCKTLAVYIEQRRRCREDCGQPPAQIDVQVLVLVHVMYFHSFHLTQSPAVLKMNQMTSNDSMIRLRLNPDSIHLHRTPSASIILHPPSSIHLLIYTVFTVHTVKTVTQLTLTAVLLSDRDGDHPPIATHHVRTCCGTSAHQDLILICCAHILETFTISLHCHYPMRQYHHTN